jgi:hypothetical protein
MTPLKALKEHAEMFHKLNLVMAELNKCAKRDPRFDMSTMTETELNQVLESNISNKEKKWTILSQLGYLRINLFYEYYTRIQFSEENEKLNEAVELMNSYLTLIMPFILERLRHQLINKLASFFSRNYSHEAAANLNEWKTRYYAWRKTEEPTDQRTDTKSRKEEYSKLKQNFFTLYHVSFSAKNFPPVVLEEFVH